MEEMSKRLEQLAEAMKGKDVKFTIEDVKLAELRLYRDMLILEKSKETGVPFEYLNQAEMPDDLPGLVAKYYQEKQDGRGEN